MTSSRVSVAVIATIAAAVTGLFPGALSGCGSSSDPAYPSDPNEGGIGADGNFDFDSGGMPDADPYANDPPPPWCGTDGGPPAPPAVGGTGQCPTDKNKPGCACDKEGQQAPCWTGLRVNRTLGVCKDGTTTCTRVSENVVAWGACQGEVLPVAGAKKGASACRCFSAGQWKIDNLSPCFIGPQGGTVFAVSTHMDGAGKAQCPAAVSPPPLPAEPWSTDSLKVDCAGHFKLCYELKAGTASAPLPTDKSIAKVCVESDYPTANAVFPFPPLPAWTSPDSAAATAFANTGGYGEMSVVGESVLCDKVDDGSGAAYVFNRVQYCPNPCPASNPICASCMQGGSGGF